MKKKTKCCGDAGTQYICTHELDGAFFCSENENSSPLKNFTEEKRAQNMKNDFCVTCGEGREPVCVGVCVSLSSEASAGAFPRTATYSHIPILLHCVPYFFFFELSLLLLVVFIVAYFALVPHRRRACIFKSKKEKKNRIGAIVQWRHKQQRQKSTQNALQRNSDFIFFNFSFRLTIIIFLLPVVRSTLL